MVIIAREGEQVRRTDAGMWLGSPVTRIKGSLNAVAKELPRCDRRPFCVTTGLTR